MCLSTADLAATLSVHLTQGFRCISWCQVQPVSKPCVYCMRVCGALHRALETICLPLSCNAQKGKGRLLKRMQHCPLTQMFHSKLLPCNQLCSLARPQVSTCTQNVHDNAYTCLYVYHVHQVNACGPMNQSGHPVQHCSKALLRVSLHVL